MLTRPTRGRVLAAATSLALVLGLGVAPAATAFEGILPPINLFSNNGDDGLNIVGDLLSDNGDDGLNIIGDCSPVLMLIVAPGEGRNGTCDNILNVLDGFGGFGLSEPAPAGTDEEIVTSDGGQGTNLFSGNGDDGLNIVGDLLSDNGDDGLNIVGDCSPIAMIILAPGDGSRGTCDNILNVLDGFGL